MKRKLVAFLLAVTLVVSLAGCAGSPSGSEKESSSVGDTKNTEEESSKDQSTQVENTEQGSTETEDTENKKPNGGTDVPPDDSNTGVMAMDATMWTTDSVNVRSLPSTSGIKLGLLPLGESIHVTGKCKDVNWYRIDYNGAIGYVSGAYVSDKKPSGGEITGETNPLKDALRDVLGKTVKKAGVIYVIGNAGFETYGYNDSRGETYAQLITKAADELLGVSNVFCMPIPLGSGVLLPAEYAGKVSVGNQEAAIDSILGHMGSNVVGVDIMGNLKAHQDEYLYFRTDHHWTQLGAYYAYVEFCSRRGYKAFTLDHYTHKAYPGFVGSFYANNKKDSASVVKPLEDNPDTVYTYGPASSATMTVTDKKGKTYTWPVINNVKDYAAGIKYSCFIAGDNPFTVIENKQIKDGSSCIVVKESYGNAFVPFLVDHYQTVYVIDQRYWDGNLITFAKEHQVTDVIFANNLSAIGSKSQLSYFKKIIG